MAIQTDLRHIVDTLRIWAEIHKSMIIRGRDSESQRPLRPLFVGPRSPSPLSPAFQAALAGHQSSLPSVRRQPGRFDLYVLGVKIARLILFLLPSALAQAAHSVSLNWQSSPTAVSYDLYRSTFSGGPYGLVASAILGTSFVDQSVTAGETYFYVATAWDGTKESGFSNQVIAVVP